MDWFQLIASIIGSIAWPIAAITIVYFLRRAIFSLLPRLRQLKYKGVEANFGEKLEEVEEEASKLPTPNLPLQPTPASEERFRNIPNIPPSFAVLEAWLNVESALLELAKLVGFDIERKSPTFRMINDLRHKKVIDDTTYATLKELRALRNLAVHPIEEQPITESQAERYRGLANQVIRVISQELLKLKLQYLKDSGVVDPNIDLFLAVINNDTELLKIALEQGGDPNITDNDLLKKYEVQLRDFQLARKAD